MTLSCDEVLAARLLGGADAMVAAHVAACPRCAATVDGVAAVRAAFAAAPVATLPPGLSARVHQAAAPLLAANARRATHRLVGRALAAALLVLPLVVLVDVRVVQALYAALTAILPTALGVYVVASWAATLTALMALTYAAIPIVAERQATALARTIHV